MLSHQQIQGRTVHYHRKGRTMGGGGVRPYLSSSAFIFVIVVIIIFVNFVIKDLENHDVKIRSDPPDSALLVFTRRVDANVYQHSGSAPQKIFSLDKSRYGTVDKYLWLIQEKGLWPQRWLLWPWLWWRRDPLSHDVIGNVKNELNCVRVPLLQYQFHIVGSLHDRKVGHYVSVLGDEKSWPGLQKYAPGRRNAAFWHTSTVTPATHPCYQNTTIPGERKRGRVVLVWVQVWILPTPSNYVCGGGRGQDPPLSQPDVWIFFVFYSLLPPPPPSSPSFDIEQVR